MILSKISALKRARWVWGVIAGVVVLGGAAAWFFLAGPGVSLTQASQEAAPTYHTTTVRRGNIRISATGSGTYAANRSVDLSFSSKGTVAELNVKAGDRVTAGQALAKLSSSEDLQAAEASAQLDLLEAQKTLSDLLANKDVALAQAYQDYVTAQQTFSDDQFARERMAYARCSKEVNKSYAAALEKADEKLSTLTTKDYGSESWIEAKNVYDTALANYNYCKAYTDDEKTSAAAAATVAKVTLDQAEAKYNTLKAASGVDPNELALDEAKVKQAETALAKAKKDLAGVTLTAPFDGVITYVAASQGTIVDTSKFITLADLSQPVVDVSVDETDLSMLALGKQAEVVFDALPDSTFAGEVTQVEPELVTSGQYQMAEGQVTLGADAAQALQNLPLGLNATVEVIKTEVKDALYVPNEAVRDLGSSQSGVFVLENGQLRLKLVETGVQDATHTEIKSGLNEGDVVSTGLTAVK